MGINMSKNYTQSELINTVITGIERISSTTDECEKIQAAETLVDLFASLARREVRNEIEETAHCH